MRAFTIGSPHHVTVARVEVPAPGPGELLVRVGACGICGTDLHIYEGSYLGSYPVVPGHEFAGTVEAVGDGVSRFSIGDRVAVEPNLPCNNCDACLENRQNFCEHWRAIGVTEPGAMAEFTLVPESAAFGIGNLPFERAAFVEPLSCVLHAVGKLTVAPGASAVVLGAGPIGVLLIRVLLRLGAASVAFAERNPSRLAFAEQEASTVAPAVRGAPDAAELPSSGYDLVVDATGATTVMAQALRLARPGGEVLWFGVPDRDAVIEFEPFQVFEKGLTVHGSFTSVRNSIQAVKMLRAGSIVVDDLVTHRVGLDGVEGALRLLAAGNGDARKVLVLPH